MPITNWGELTKALDDAQSILEAIDEKIDSHNADPDAHLGPNGSLLSHKASEIIDHLAESIVRDKISPFSLDYSLFTNSKFQVVCNFESVDGLNFLKSGTGSWSHKLGALLLNSGVGIGQCECVSAWPDAGGGPAVNFSKNPVLQVVANCPYPTYGDFYILIGPTQVPPTTGDSIGIKVAQGVPYFGVAQHGSAYTWYQIYGSFNFANTNVFKIEVVSGACVNLYINSVLVYTYTGTIPSGNYAHPFTAVIVDKIAGGNSQLVLTHMLFQQDL